MLRCAYVMHITYHVTAYTPCDAVVMKRMHIILCITLCTSTCRVLSITEYAVYYHAEHVYTGR